MHEISIAKELSDIVIRVAENEKLAGVTKVNICFGEMVQIVPDIFNFAFQETVKETIIRGAEVNIEILPVRLKCRECSGEFRLIDYNNFYCSKCNSTDLEIIQGKEMYVKSIEGE